MVRDPRNFDIGYYKSIYKYTIKGILSNNFQFKDSVLNKFFEYQTYDDINPIRDPSFRSDTSMVQIYNQGIL